MKSQKAVKLSFIGALMITLMVFIIFLLMNAQNVTKISGYVILICLLAIAIASFFIFYFLLNKYLFGRLNPVYKNLTLHEGNFELDSDERIKAADIASSINIKLNVREEDQKEEINQMIKHEMFRKEFLGNVSHELKTPIFAVQGYVHTLIDGGIDDADINMLYLKKAAKSVDRLINIIEDLESVSKIEGGEMMLDKQTFDINAWVKDTIESLELMANEQGVTLRVDPKTDKAFYVSADKNAIRQVLVNLIVNSIKYCSVDGTTEISYSQQADKVLVHVKDNGIGISAENQNRLFERFYRVDKSRSREQGGTGLGLSIVKHIVETHGGLIRVNSEPGEGSTFTFSLDKA